METIRQLGMQVQETLHINQSNALVTGATGIIGNATVKRLAESSKWGTIHAISRSRPPTESYAKVKHTSADLLSSPEEVARHLRESGVENVHYVFYSAYMAKDDESEASEVNGKMLRNLLEGLHLADPGNLKRVVLTSGLKFYGVHLGQVMCPMEETDPRVDGEEYPPNFYYTQEDILRELAPKQGWDWSIAMPNDVAGFAKGNFMNLSICIALYALISKELGEPFYFPGNATFYGMLDDISHADLIAEFEEWLALTPAATGLFNITNGDHNTWCKTWPRLARYFGTTVPSDNFTAETPYKTEKTLPFPPPINLRIKETSYAQKLDNSVVLNRISLAKWSERKEVKDAWQAIAKREKLDAETFEHGTFGFADFVWGRQFDVYASMTKARKLGWTGYMDTFEGYVNVFETMRRNKMIP